MPVPNDHIIHYTFDNITGNTVNDETGNYDGTIIGTATQVPGVIDDGINLDYGENYVTNDAIAPFAKSISAWFRVSSITNTFPTNNRVIYSSRAASKGFMVYAAYDAAGFKIAFANRDTSITTTLVLNISAVFNLNQIYHVALSISDTDVKVYLDSVLQYHIGISAPYSGMDESTIGREATTSYRFDGMIDQFRIYDRPLAQNEIDALYTEGSLLLGLQAHYTMDNISGNTLVDETGNYDGTITGALPVVGTIGNALSFDGIDDVVYVNSPVLVATFSISLWFKIQTTPAGSQIIYSQQNATGGNNYRGLFVTATYISFISRDASGGSEQIQALTTDYFDDAWHMCVISQINADMEMWIDSVSVGTATVTLHQTVWNPLAQIGSRVSSDDLSLDGKIDQLRIYDRALNQTEIDSLYLETSETVLNTLLQPVQEQNTLSSIIANNVTSLLPVTEQNTLASVVLNIVTVMAPVAELNIVEHITETITLQFEEVDVAVSLQVTKTFTLKSYYETDTVLPLSAERIFNGQSLQETDLLFTVFLLPDFHEIQEVQLRVNMYRYLGFDVTRNQDFSMHITSKVPKTFNVTNNISKTFRTSPVARSNLGG